MKRMQRICEIVVLGLLAGILLQACSAKEGKASSGTASPLGRGVNLGNALEAPPDADWRMFLQEDYFDLIQEAGFESVRIPIKWSAHAAETSPYTIDSKFFERVDWTIDSALERNLSAVINIHHYDAMVESPQEHKERFLAIWEQIASHYRDYPPELYFELLNEPHGPLNAEIWNRIIPEALNTIRKTNPDRNVIVGPVDWNGYSALPTLALSKEDRNLIVTFHYYLPFHFTHQGASWVDGSDAWLGAQWTGTTEEKKTIKDHFDQVAQWAREHQRRIYLGEFGAYSRADMASRVRWTRFIREQAEERDFGWAYWEFGSGFGVYDRESKGWRKELLEALIPGSGVL